MRFFVIAACSLVLAACGAPPLEQAPRGDTLPGRVASANDAPPQVTRLISVAERMEPVAEAWCRQEAPDIDCDFDIRVLPEPRLGINAFQLAHPETGQPLILLTIGLVARSESVHELAWVIAHEAAHHIRGHSPRRIASAQAGAQTVGLWAQQNGATREEAQQAAQFGALVAARRFSQAAELEADELGTLIACRAGYNPLRGAELFAQLPDPGNNYFATHPPHDLRIATVRRAVRQGCR